MYGDSEVQHEGNYIEIADMTATLIIELKSNPRLIAGVTVGSVAIIGVIDGAAKFFIQKKEN